jgi:hypothetical protein
MGIPTTANYILVATLMAPVVVDLGAQAGLAIPLIAVHLFVFYFGIMADITPPVGLASFAAAAISKEDPIATGFQGALYSLRTAILPFVFVFNPAMLLIGVDTWAQTIWVAAVSLAAILIFSAATMNWFVTRSRLWESAILLVACFTLFRPDWWLNQVSPPYEERPASEFLSAVEQAPADARINFVVQGVDLMGDDVRKTVNVPLGEPGEALQRLRSIGLTVAPLGDTLMISDVAFGSYAKRIGLEPGQRITAVVVKPADRPSVWWVYGPALALVALIWWNQRRRARPQAEPLAGPTGTAPGRISAA